MSTTIKHILVAHDFSQAAQMALDYALDLAATLKAKVTVVHAYELPVYGFPEGLTLAAEMPGHIQQMASKALEGIVAHATHPGVTIEGMVREGAAWSEICAAATEAKVDLIVIGTHGRRGLAHALLGSVAEKVVRSAPCPVLTIRGPNPE